MSSNFVILPKISCSYGSVVEHTPSKRKVRSSILRGSFLFLKYPRPSTLSSVGRLSALL